MTAEKEYRKERLDRGIKVRTDGIYALSDWPEILYLLAPRIIFISLILLLPLIVIDPYWRRVVSIVFIYILLAIGFDFLSNYVGLVCLGGSFFIGIGSYISALTNIYLGFPIYLSIPIATIGGGIFCTALMIPCLRLRGVYFAIASLMYPLIAIRLFEALNAFGGTDGLMGVTGFNNEWISQWFLIIMCLVFLFSLRRFVTEDYGLLMRAVKDNDQSVRSSGINITWVKAFAVFIASSMGCFGGAYLAHFYMFTGLSSFALDFSIIPIAAVVIGGPGTLTGAVIGSLILVPLSELLRTFGTLRIAFYSVVLLIFIIWKSEGLMVWAERKYHQLEKLVEV